MAVIPAALPGVFCLSGLRNVVNVFLKALGV
jgi:hypothetical protein